MQPAWDAWRRLFFVAAGLLALIGLAWVALRLLAHVRGTLTVLALGGVLAILLDPAVDRLERPLRRRGLAVLAVVAGLLAGVAVAATLVLGPLVADLLALAARLPAYGERLAQALAGIEDWLAARGLRAEAQAALGGALAALRDRAPALLASALRAAGAAGGAVGTLVLAGVVAAYLLLDGGRLRQRTLALLPAAWRDQAEVAFRVAGRTVGAYVRGQLLLGLIIGVAAGVGTALLGLPYAVFLGVAAGVFELVPTVGAVLGAIPALAVAAFEPFPRVLYVAAFFLVLQQLEGAVLVPRVTGQAVGLHPLAALLALLAGFEVAGVAGALVAVPVVAVGWGLLRAWRVP